MCVCMCVCVSVRVSYFFAEVSGDAFLSQFVESQAFRILMLETEKCAPVVVCVCVCGVCVCKWLTANTGIAC